MVPRIEPATSRACILLAATVAIPGCYTGWDAVPGAAAESGVQEPGGPDDEGTTGSDGGSEASGDEPNAGCDAAASVPMRMRRLTRSQYRHTIRDLLGLEAEMIDDFEPDEVVAGFRNNAGDPVSRTTVEDYMTAAEELATRAVVDVELLAGCTDPGCERDFVEDFGRRAWRRPLTDAELERLLALHTSGADFTDGIRLVVAAVLQSPHFLYLVELGTGEPEDDGRLPLSQYELASRLSYLLWDSMPDDALLDAAETGMLADAEGLRAEAERMLDEPRARDAIANLHRQWFSVPEYELETVSKDPDVFPEWTETLREAMGLEIGLRADYHVRFGDGSLESLIASPITIVDEELAALYGVDPAVDGVELPAGLDLPEGFVGVQLDPQRSAGALSQAGVMATLAKPNDTNTPLRGRFVFENLLCGDVPDPPPDIDAEPPQPDPDATAREQLEAQTSVQPCAGCHALINPLGFALDNYDSIGRHRNADEFGRPLDTAVEYAYPGLEGEFQDATQIVAALARTEALGACAAEKWFRFTFPLDPVHDTPEVECALESLTTVFEESGYDMRELLLAIATSDAFRYRAPGEI